MSTVSIDRSAVPPDEAFAWFRKNKVHGPAGRSQGRLSMTSWVDTPRGRAPVQIEFVPEKGGGSRITVRSSKDSRYRIYILQDLRREVLRMERSLGVARTW